MGVPDENPLADSGKYRVDRLLGAGAMGEVYLAHHLTLDKPVVIKVILAELACSPTRVDRMRLEAQVLARLDHPNIVRVTDFDQTPDGRPFMVMDFLRGRTVAEEMLARGGYLPAGEALEIVRQAAAGLATAHHAGLVHRDLKLENLFLCDPPEGVPAQGARRTVKVIDFGLAKTLEGESKSVLPLAMPTESGIVVGTPAFLAPEQAAGRTVDHRADIYALGLVLYTLLAHRGPFDDADSIAALVEAQIRRQPEPPSKHASQVIPPELDALVLRCLAKQPSERPQSATELSAKLAGIITRLGVAGDATTPQSRPAASEELADIVHASTLPSGGSDQQLSPLRTTAGDGTEHESDPGSVKLGDLASTLPMDGPTAGDLGLDGAAGAAAPHRATVPMPVAERPPPEDDCGATSPRPGPLQVEPVPMEALLRPATAPMNAMSATSDAPIADRSTATGGGDGVQLPPTGPPSPSASPYPHQPPTAIAPVSGDRAPSSGTRRLLVVMLLLLVGVGLVAAVVGLAFMVGR